MNIDDVNDLLFQFNNYEIIQRSGVESINDIKDLSSNEEDLFDTTIGYVRLPKEPFFKDDNIYISKHNRFAEMTEHVHDFIEINYVYSGSCRQKINGNEVNLSKGTFCVLDRDVPHSIDALSENDILINILINNQTFSSLFLFQLEKNNTLLGNFLYTAFDSQSKHDNYMLFNSYDSPQIHLEIQLLLREYWSNDINSNAFVIDYLQLIISELLRIFIKKEQKASNLKKLNYVKVLEYLDDNYQTVQLNDLKYEFNYNSNYISNILKEGTGKNFQEILLEKKLLVAKDLLQHSEQSIESIATKVGFNSLSYFYRQFKKRYQITPKKYREQINN